jgi:hypothetical protein
MTTITGAQEMIGKVKLNLNVLTGHKGAQVVHLAEIPKGTLFAILGTDLLRPYKGYPRYSRAQWWIKIGKRSFRADGSADVQEQLG